MATTRKQMFLEKIHDSSFATPVPVTVEEEILDGTNGGGGGVEIYDAAFTQDAVTVAGLTYRDVRQKMNEGKLIILRGRDATTKSFVSLYIVVSFSVSGDPEHYGVNGITFQGQISFIGENLDDELALYRD